MAPISPIPNTAAGWPYMPDNQPVADTPEYSRLLAAALNGFTPGAGSPVGDTGWIDARTLVTWGSGWSALAANYGWKALSYRAIGNDVYWNGLVQAAAAGTNASSTVFTIPVALAMLRPDASNIHAGGFGSTNQALTFLISASGAVAVQGTWAAGPIGFSIHYIKN